MKIGIFLIADDEDIHEDSWIEDYSGPENSRGYKQLTLTNDQARAKKFDSALEAIKFWQQTSETHPVRLSDGKPNRPLTGYTACFDPLRDVH